jgi:hypothetical protein
MVRGIKRGQDGKKPSIEGRFEKVDHGRGPGYIYTIFGLDASLAGLPGQARSIKLARARWPGPSPELANEDHWGRLSDMQSVKTARSR